MLIRWPVPRYGVHQLDPIVKILTLDGDYLMGGVTDIAIAGFKPDAFRSQHRKDTVRAYR